DDDDDATTNDSLAAVCLSHDRGAVGIFGRSEHGAGADRDSGGKRAMDAADDRRLRRPAHWRERAHEGAVLREHLADYRRYDRYTDRTSAGGSVVRIRARGAERL